MPDSAQDTLDHIEKVRWRIYQIQMKLTARAAVHDASKLEEPEKSGFDVLTFKLATLVYGSEEYKAALEEGKPTIAHHYAVNSHHPEHWPAPTGAMIDILRQDITILQEVRQSIKNDIEAQGPLDTVEREAYDALIASVTRNIIRLEHDLATLESRVNGMSLLDVVEMLSDWKAASERTKQGSIAQSLPVNKERFQIDDQLYAILENTVRELGW